MTNETEKTDAENKSKGILVSTAKAIGKAAGTVAATVVHKAPALSPSAPVVQEAKRGKLMKRVKTRLPRREKKALGKAQLRSQSSSHR
jgi:trans-2-enoyl-CoA reductase